MAWASGSITSDTPCAAFSTAFKNLVGTSGVANWSFVENIPAGTGTGQSGSTTYSVDVFKCSGTGTDANSAATDWYFCLRIPVPDQNNTYIYYGMAEDYEGGTDKRFKRIVPNAASTSAPTGAGFWKSDSYATYASAGMNLNSYIQFPNNGYQYWIKLDKDYVLLSIRRSNGTEYCIGGGLIDSMTSVSDPCPLVSINQQSYMFFSRLPSVTQSTHNKWQAFMVPWTWQGFTSQSLGAQDIWQGGKVLLSRMAVYHDILDETGLQSSCGSMRGMLKSSILGMLTTIGGDTTKMGDTIVYGGNTWTVISPTGYWQGVNNIGNNSSTIKMPNLYSRLLVRAN